MCISRHMKKEKSYLLIISQACKISWWYILRFYVCITWLSTILSVVIGDENIFKIETRLPNFKNLVLGGKKITKPNQQKNRKKGIGLILKVPVVNILSYSVSTTVLPCLLSYFWNESWLTILPQIRKFLSQPQKLNPQISKCISFTK